MTWRSSKCKGKLLYIFASTVAFLCFAASAACLTIVLILFCPECAWPNSLLVWVNGAGSVALFTIGIMTLWMLIFRPKTQNTSTAQVVVSEIPAEDVEKSPAPVLPYHHIPHRQSPLHETSSMDLPDYFISVQNSNAVGASSIDLPDYFSSVQNSNEIQASLIDLPDYCSIVQANDEVSLPSVDVDLWTNDAPKTPPPCYEQALEMGAMAASVNKVYE